MFGAKMIFLQTLGTLCTPRKYMNRVGPFPSGVMAWH